MDGSSPSSSVPKKQEPVASSPGSASNLDSFFKRLGQGQSSRLWAGPAGSSGAVPGSLRTSRLHPRDGDRDGLRPAGAGAGTVDSTPGKGSSGGGGGDDGGAAAGTGELQATRSCSLAGITCSSEVFPSKIYLYPRFGGLIIHPPVSELAQ